MSNDSTGGYSGGPVTVQPAPPTYRGAATAKPTTTGTSNPDDIFTLGNLYDKPIYLGVNPGSSPTPNHHLEGDPDQRPVTQGNAYGKTQDIIANATKLFGQQEAERKKHPHQLTSYERLQQQLWQAGFYGQTSYDSIHVGQWTSQTQSALKNALTAYESATSGGQLPETFDEFVSANQRFGQDGGQSSKKGKGAATTAPSINLTDPDAIKQAAQAAAMQALGGSLTEDQLNQFVQQFQQQQTQYQSAPAGTTSTAPDLSSQAAAYAQQVDPQAYQQQQHQSYLDALVNLFAGPGATGRPTMTPTPKAS